MQIKLLRSVCILDDFDTSFNSEHNTTELYVFLALQDSILQLEQMIALKFTSHTYVRTYLFCIVLILEQGFCVQKCTYTYLLTNAIIIFLKDQRKITSHFMKNNQDIDFSNHLLFRTFCLPNYNDENISTSIILIRRSQISSNFQEVNKDNPYNLLFFFID